MILSISVKNSTNEFWFQLFDSKPELKSKLLSPGSKKSGPSGETEFLNNAPRTAQQNISNAFPNKPVPFPFPLESEGAFVETGVDFYGDIDPLELQHFERHANRLLLTLELEVIRRIDLNQANLEGDDTLVNQIQALVHLQDWHHQLFQTRQADAVARDSLKVHDEGHKQDKWRALNLCAYTTTFLSAIAEEELTKK